MDGMVTLSITPVQYSVIMHALISERNNLSARIDEGYSYTEDELVEFYHERDLVDDARKAIAR